MLKHAYLVLVYKYTMVLDYLVHLLDNENNDIYIHVDKKAENTTKERIRNLQQTVKKSNVFVFCKYKVFWGTNSIIKAQKYILTKSVDWGGGMTTITFCQKPIFQLKVQ